MLQKRNDRTKPLKRSRYDSSSRQEKRDFALNFFFVLRFFLILVLRSVLSLKPLGMTSLGVSALPAKQGRGQLAERENVKQCAG